MCNHCTNHVTITHPSPLILTELVKALSTDHQRERYLPRDPSWIEIAPFDFDVLIPRPTILSRTLAGGCHIDGKLVQLAITDDIRGVGGTHTPIYRHPTPDELVLLTAIGYTNWYDWSVVNWGTKWNTYSCSRNTDGIPDGSLSYRFDTAWNAPTPIMHALLDFACNLARSLNHPTPPTIDWTWEVEGDDASYVWLSPKSEPPHAS